MFDSPAFVKSTDNFTPQPSSATTTTSQSPTMAITSTEEFLLAEDIDSQEETEDESDQVIEDVLVRLVCRPSFVCRRRLPSSSLS